VDCDNASGGYFLSKLRPLLVFGTRPEAIKMAPIVHECRRRADLLDPIVCLTEQHREMLAQVVEYFGIQDDERLHLMTENQTLAALTARCVEGIDDVLARRCPDCVVAQGDTTTVMASAIATFYRRIPFVHVEAGLRTGSLRAPWPEEFNRRVASTVACLHCAPTKGAAEALIAEGVSPDSVHVTGNTVIDALLYTVCRERSNGARYVEKYSILGSRDLVLITAHRRESFGDRFEGICRAIRVLADRFPNKAFVYPVHLNPNVHEPAYRLLSDTENVHLIEPVAYPEFVWLMDRCTLILTDSGGVQEEAISLQKPVVVMRDTTERPEGVKAGGARLVGTSTDVIVQNVTRFLTDAVYYAAHQVDQNPYGDGRAAERIVDLMIRHFGQ